MYLVHLDERNEFGVVRFGCEDILRAINLGVIDKDNEEIFCSGGMRDRGRYWLEQDEEEEYDYVVIDQKETKFKIPKARWNMGLEVKSFREWVCGIGLRLEFDYASLCYYSDCNRIKLSAWCFKTDTGMRVRFDFYPYCNPSADEIQSFIGNGKVYLDCDGREMYDKYDDRKWIDDFSFTISNFCDYWRSCYVYDYEIGIWGEGCRYNAWGKCNGYMLPHACLDCRFNNVLFSNGGTINSEEFEGDFNYRHENGVWILGRKRPGRGFGFTYHNHRVILGKNTCWTYKGDPVGGRKRFHYMDKLYDKESVIDLLISEK